MRDLSNKDETRIYNNPYVDTPYLMMESLSRGTLMELIENVNAARYWNMNNEDKPDEMKLGVRIILVRL